jgi:hypothetical protein
MVVGLKVTPSLHKNLYKKLSVTELSVPWYGVGKAVKVLYIFLVLYRSPK